MTYEEIKEKYPIGKVLCSKAIDSQHTRAWYTQEDIAIYKQIDEVDSTIKSSTECYQTDTYERKVEGWLFDGEKWQVVEDSWYGWVPYSEEELEDLKLIDLKENI